MQEGLKPLTVYEREYLEDELKRAENSLAIELEMEPGSHAACFKLATTIKALKAALTRPADSPKAAKVELVERLEQHLKDCVDYIETHRPMNTRRCKEWEDANHFLLYDWLEANRAALQPKPEAKDWLTRSDLLWWRNWFLQRKEAKGELFAFERVALNVLDMALASLTPSPKDDGTIRAQLEALERMGRVVAEAAKREKQLLKLLKPDCWQPYQADDSSQSYSGPDECLDDYYNDHENLLVGDIVFIEAVCIRKQAWRLDAQANAEEGDGPMWSLVMDEGAPQAEPIGEREDGTMAPQIGDKQ